MPQNISAKVSFFFLPQKLPGVLSMGTRIAALSTSSNRPNRGFCFAVVSVIRNQPLVRQPLAFHASHVRPDGRDAAILTDKVERWQAVCVRLESELVYVPRKMFLADMVERAVVGAFEQRPKRFDAVGVR